MTPAAAATLTGDGSGEAAGEASGAPPEASSTPEASGEAAGELDKTEGGHCRDGSVVTLSRLVSSPTPRALTAWSARLAVVPGAKPVMSMTHVSRHATGLSSSSVSSKRRWVVLPSSERSHSRST